MENQFALAFYVITHFEISQDNAIDLLQLLENEGEELPTEKIPIDYIAPLLHQLYVLNNNNYRCSVLRLISFFEKNSQTTILEKYHFDKLVCQSLEQKEPDPPVKIDEEKLASFCIVNLMIKLRRTLPLSIARSLVSLYFSPQQSYKSLIVSSICEAFLLCDDFPFFPEIFDVLNDFILQTGNSNAIDFLGYIIENDPCLVHDKHFALTLLSPFSITFNQKANYSQSITTAIQLLRSWPILFYLGFKNRGILELLRTLPHHAQQILTFFQKLLLLDGPAHSCINGYTGILLFYLMQHDIIQLLANLPSINEETSAFIYDLIFYSNHCNKSPEISSDAIDKFLKHSQFLLEQKTETQASFLKSPILAIAHTLNSVSASTATHLPLPNEVLSWNWDMIYQLLTIVLPHKEAELKSSNAQNFYRQFLSLFKSHFPPLTPTNYVKMARCVYALFDLLMASEWGRKYLSESSAFNEGVLAAISSIEKVIENESYPIWAYLDCFCKIMSAPEGPAILMNLNIMQHLELIESKFASPEQAKRFLSMIQFHPEASLSTLLYFKFSQSHSPQIVQFVLNEIRIKSKTTPNFYSDCLKPILLAFIKSLHAKLGNAASENSNYNFALSILCEMMIDSEKCRGIVASDTAMHSIIKESSHEMYSILLNSKELASSVDSEIEYWMENGIYQYVTTYDTAVSTTFGQKSNPVPSIVIIDNHAIVPPHIFGQLSQSKEGFKKLSLHVPKLLNMLKSPEQSIDEKRAALFALGHFGSAPNGVTPEIVQIMIDSALNEDSYVLVGTLIESLSLIERTPKIMEVLNRNKFVLFAYGKRSCIIPASPDIVIPFYIEEDEDPILNKVPSPPQPILEHILLLLNPVHAQQSKVLIHDTAVKDAQQQARNPSLLTTNNALYLHEVLQKAPYPYDIRHFLYGQFKDIPLLRPVKIKNEQIALHQAIAKVFEVPYLNKMLLATAHFSSIKLQSIPASAIKTSKPKTPVPEVYLSDSEFRQVTGINSREAFYQLSFQDQQRIRMKLMS